MWEPHQLPEGQAAYGKNCYALTGALQGWRVPDLVRQNTNPDTAYVYRVPIISEVGAFAYLLFDRQPDDLTRVTISELTYVFTSNSANIPTSPAPGALWVLKGATIPDTISNFLAAVTYDNGAGTNAGTLYSSGSNGNHAVASTYTATPGLPGPNNETPGPLYQSTVTIGATTYNYAYIVAPLYGAAYNTVFLGASSGSGVLWLKDLLSLVGATTSLQGGTNPSFINDITGPSTWLEFADPDTNVVKSQVVDDQYDRFYYASPSTPPFYNTYDRIVGGQPSWVLGLNPPGCAPTVTVSGGGNYLQLPTVSTPSGSGYINGNYVYLVPIVPTGAMQCKSIQMTPLQNISAALTNGAYAFQWAGVLYADGSYNGATPTTPSELLNIGTVQNGAVYGTAGASGFANPTSLLANTPYWIGIIVSAQIKLQGSGLNNGALQFANTFSNGPASIAPTAAAGPNLNVFAELETSSIIEARAYVYTWLSAYGEESAPSPPTLQNGWTNGTWSVGLFTPNPDDMGVLRNIAALRLYRTVTATGGYTTYFWVGDVSVGSTNPDALAYLAANPLVPPQIVNGVQATSATGVNPPTDTYVDNTPDNVVAYNFQMPSTNWFPPPADIQGFLTMPNGVVAGFADNEVWFCQPYYMHAWPPGYVLTTDFPVVGLGFTNGTLVILTNNTPYTVTGTTPGAFQMNKCSQSNPCSSRGSIVSSDYAVSFMSQNGLIQVNNTGQATNLTDLWVGRANWQTKVPQMYTRAVLVMAQYFCFGTVSPPSVSPQNTSVAQEGFSLDLANDTGSFTIWPTPGGHRVGFQNFSSFLGENLVNVETDPWTGFIVMVANGGTYFINFADENYDMVQYTYTSKIYQFNNKRNFSAIRVFFDTIPSTPTQNFYPNTAPATDPSWNTLEEGQYGIIQVYANGQLVCSREIRASGGILRIGGGFKCEQWQFKITARVIISSVRIATSVKELANIAET